MTTIVYQNNQSEIIIKSVAMNHQYVIGGLLAAVGLGFLAYRYSDDGKGNSAQSVQALTKSEILAILRDLRSELSQIYMTIASFSMSIKEQSGFNVGVNEIKEILMTQTPIKAQISKAENKVYEKHGTTQEAVQLACLNEFSQDQEIQNSMKSMRDNLENSFKGIPPKMEGELPKFLTPELTLRVMHEMNDAAKIAMYDIIEGIKDKGISLNQNDPQFQLEIQKASVLIEKEQYKVFEKFGLTTLNQPATIILQQAMQKFTQTNPMFLSQFAQDQDELNKAMQSIFTGSFPRSQYEDIKRRLIGQPLFEELSSPREVLEEEFANEDFLYEESETDTKPETEAEIKAEIEKTTVVETKTETKIKTVTKEETETETEIKIETEA